MKAAVVGSAGAPPTLGEFAEPPAQPGREPLGLVAAGVHQIVRSRAAGRHYSSTGSWPLVPGIDAVARNGAGTLVYAARATDPWGTMAERMVTAAALDLPTGADPLAVAAGVNPALSGWLPLRARRAELGRLGTVLVLGATGMSGSLAVGSAALLGAERVVAAGRDRATLARLGASGADTVALVGNHSADAAALQEALGDRAPSLVLDYLWGSVAEAAFAALMAQHLARPGLAEAEADIAYAEIGSLAGESAAVPSPLLRGLRIRVFGSGAGSATDAELFAAIPEVIEAVGTGRLAVPYTAYPLSRVSDAWTHPGRDRAVVVPD